MNFISLLFISIGLAMDAFAVSITEGLAMKKLRIKQILKVAIVFGLFQAIMPVIGWKVGTIFSDSISRYDYLITSTLLILVGLKMVFDGWNQGKCEVENKCDINSNVFMLGFATSIDALAIGFSFSLVPGINIFYATGFIGMITFFISSIGVFVGYKIGYLINYKTEYIGGAILILLGLKLLLEKII